MSFLFSNKTAKESFLIVAILEREILCFLVEVAGSKRFLISYRKISHNVSLGSGLTVDKMRKFKKALNSVLDLAREDAQKHFGRKRVSLDGAFAIYSSPWFFTDQVHINLEGSDILVSKEELDKEIKNKFSEPAGEDKRASEPWKLSLIEQSLNQIKVNGYILSNPFGKRARSVEVSASAESIFPEMQNLIEKGIESFFKINKVESVSLPKACSLCAVDNKLELPAVFLFLDKSKTVVTEVWQNGSYSAKVMDYGTEDIMKTASQVFGFDEGDVAASYLRLSREKILSEKLSSQAAVAIGESMIDWQFQVKNAISDFTKWSPLGSIVVVCPRAMKSFFRNFISDQLPVQAGFQGLEELEEIISNPLNLKSRCCN